MASEIKNYAKVLSELKQRIRVYDSHTAPKTNAGLLQHYWDIGNVILKQQKAAGWKVKVTMQLAKNLTHISLLHACASREK